MNKIKLAVAMLACLLTTQVVLGDHGTTKETDIQDGGLVTSESFKRNFFFYKEIGGETRVKGKKKKRKWWCAFLCKRRVDRKVDLIEIRNTYFSEVGPGTFESLEEERSCSNASSCRQRESALGFTFNLNFKPGGITNLLPVHGVVTRHRIVDDGQPAIIVFTSKGKHPTPVIR